MNAFPVSNAEGDPFSGAPSKPPLDDLATSTPDQTDLISGSDGALARLDPHHDARALVRLVQCSICSQPLRTPVTLPCGNSCCRQCLPSPHLREHITFSTANRQQGIACPFTDCQQPHALEECSTNVVLSKIMDNVRLQVAVCRLQRTEAATPPHEHTLEEILSSEPVLDAESDTVILEKPHTYPSKGGRLMATFDFAETGLLAITSDVRYEDMSPASEDEQFLQALKDATAKEMECNVCYHPMLEPTTTPCGHTFCRKCLARVLDYSSLCPECRRELFLPSTLSRQPSNKYLVQIMKSLCPEQVAARVQALALEESATPEGLDTPLFPCTVAYPGLKTFLHIFEPRYRLMIRRCIQGNGNFGIMAYNRFLEPQGELGRTQFMQIGTMLKIEQYSLLEDGRSIIECQGLYRFKVREHGMLDGYIVANVEKLHDISLADEEELEARETTSSQPAAEDDRNGQIERMSTTELREFIMGFIQRARDSSSRWVHNRLLETYGEPPESAAQLPYWLAAVLPLTDGEKYRVLPTNSARERLKIAARWVNRIESQRCARFVFVASSDEEDEGETDNDNENENNEADGD